MTPRTRTSAIAGATRTRLHLRLGFAPPGFSDIPLPHGHLVVCMHNDTVSGNREGYQPKHSKHSKHEGNLLGDTNSSLLFCMDDSFVQEDGSVSPFPGYLAAPHNTLSVLTGSAGQSERWAEPPQVLTCTTTSSPSLLTLHHPSLDTLLQIIHRSRSMLTHCHGPHRHQQLLSAHLVTASTNRATTLRSLKSGDDGLARDRPLVSRFHGAQAIDRLRRRAKEEHSPIRATAIIQTKAQ